MPTLILAIDQSTSATKALLFDAQTFAVVARASAEHAQHYPQPGHVEHDAAEIWRNTLRAASEVIGQVDAASIACVSLTNQRETIVVFDRATGEPLMPAIVWQCRRSEAICRELAPHDALVTAKTGLKVDPYFSATKLTWLARERPEIVARLRDGSAVVSTIDAFLIHRMTGGQTFATDASNASRTLLYDIHAMRWDDELCRLFDVPMQALPEVRDSTAAFGETTLGGLLPRAIPIRGVLGDSQASLFALRAFEPGACKVTLGTGSSILVNTGPRVTSGGPGVMTTVAWTHDGQPTYCYEGIVNHAAATLEWLKNQLGILADVRDAEAIAMSLPDNGGVYLVPAFGGLSAPHWLNAARGAIVGLSSHSGRAHVVRAALEAIAYQVADALHAMRDQASLNLTRVTADGGPTRNRFLMQFIADIVGLEIRVADVPDCSPMGAAMAGALGLGIFPSIEALAATPGDNVIYRPTMPAEDVARLRAGWNRAVRQVTAGVSE